MPRGLTPEQIGVTERMIATYGDFIWEHSNNVQIRHGDPVRNLDFAAIAQQRAGLGMTDEQIAAMLGLTRDEVLQIRVILEARRYDRRHYARLLELGGHRRFRSENHVPHEMRDCFSAEALHLRQALRFDPARVARYVEAGWWSNDTLADWIGRAAAQATERKAVVAPSGDLSYRELAEASLRFASGLRRLGIRRGDVVSLQLPNIPEFLIAYLGITRLGAVMSTVHSPYRTADTQVLLNHSRALAFIGQSKVKDYSPAAEALGLKATLPTLKTVIALGEPVAGTVAFADLLSAEPKLPAGVNPVPADPFLLLFTSGTSARPKAVPLTYQMTLGNARLGAPEHEIGAEDVVLSAAPFTHLLGLYALHLALSVGAATLTLPVFSPTNMLATIERDRPTVLFTAPAHLATLLHGGLLDSADLSSLRLVVVSGSLCPPDLARAIAAKLPNGRFTQLWGMTELQAGTYTRPCDPIEIAANTAGRPSPGTEIRTVDLYGNPQGPGQEGELQVRGSLMFPGYFGDEESNRNAFTGDGWFRTGDVAMIDAHGNLHITGRIKDVINRGGIKYNPRDIEDAIVGHPKVAQAAIVAYPDAVLGERACCFIVSLGDRPPTLEEICSYLVDRGISKIKLPERLEVIEEMPMTPTRKIIKGRLRERLLGAS